MHEAPKNPGLKLNLFKIKNTRCLSPTLGPSLMKNNPLAVPGSKDPIDNLPQLCVGISLTAVVTDEYRQMPFIVHQAPKKIGSHFF